MGHNKLNIRRTQKIILVVHVLFLNKEGISNVKGTSPFLMPMPIAMNYPEYDTGCK